MHGSLLLIVICLSLFGTLSLAAPMYETDDAMPMVHRLFALRLQRRNINNEEDNQVTPPKTEEEASNAIPMVHRLITERLPRIFTYSSDNDQTGRNFPEVDERGFDEDVFDEGFGEWEPMRF